MSAASVIESLKAKVEQLIARHKELDGNLQASVQREQKLKMENRRLSERVAELEAELKAAELRAGLGGGGTKRDAARITTLMREIDRCIALVKQ